MSRCADQDQNEIATYEKQLFDLRQLLEISKSLSSTLDFNTLMETVLYICMGQMQALNVGLFTRKSFDSVYFSLNNNYKGFELDDSVEYVIKDEHPLISLLNRTNCCFTLEEIQNELGSMDGLEALSALEPDLIVPLKAKARVNGVLVLGGQISIDNNGFTEYEKEHILNIASLVAIAINTSALLEMTTTDMMTRLKLKHFFYTVLADQIEEAKGQEKPLCVLMMDIDHFKKFNDTYGHSCGDVVLQQVAHVIQNNVRSQDMAARYGGEEFCVMLCDTEPAIAKQVAERIRRSVETMEIVYENQHLSVTISLGVAAFNPKIDTTPKTFVDRADAALYVSKQEGRNRVTMAE
ncbi:MAG: GGDEF domain-containing protein [Spirochaetes bacterium]|uniref:diguanylate cyclase n=1 Tax=Candidatus Gallitreponema excrementavium TaxID=2840840 RepID=A0A9D9N2C6_9SPIR|nr:GGDEF domain-containing protein [Candidatus Gallitreponema excrementavium]